MRLFGSSTANTWIYIRQGTTSVNELYIVRYVTPSPHQYLAKVCSDNNSPVQPAGQRVEDRKVIGPPWTLSTVHDGTLLRLAHTQTHQFEHGRCSLDSERSNT